MLSATPPRLTPRSWYVERHAQTYHHHVPLTRRADRTGASSALFSSPSQGVQVVSRSAIYTNQICVCGRLYASGLACQTLSQKLCNSVCSNYLEDCSGFGNFFDPVSSVYVACELVSVRTGTSRAPWWRSLCNLCRGCSPHWMLMRQLCNPGPAYASEPDRIRSELAGHFGSLKKGVILQGCTAVPCLTVLFWRFLHS